MSSFEKKIRRRLNRTCKSEIGTKKVSVMLVRMEDNSATLTPFGSVIRISPAKVANSSRSWTAKLRAVLALLFH